MFFVFGGTLDPNFEKSPNARVSGEWPLLQGPVLMIFRLGFPGSRAYCFTSGISAKGFGFRIQVVASAFRLGCGTQEDRPDIH